jgi:tight adherence protein B
MSLDLLAIAFLAAVSVGAIFYAFIYPLLSGEARVEKRVESMGRTGEQKRAAARITELNANRKKSVSDSLKDLEKNENEKRRISLEDRLEQAGLSWDRRTFFMVSGGAGFLFAVIFFVLTSNPLVAGMGLLIGGLGLPNWFLSFQKKRRMTKFIDEFPNAIDIIVRGIKSGLPLGDCLRIIASEAREPLKSEFRSIIEAQSLGLSVSEACGRLFKRMPIQEANFFVIVIQIQQKAGGNLAEALANLSRVLRERKRMKQKISAMSMEAKASGVIIAALPFIVAMMVQMSSPGFLVPLYSTQFGHMLLLGSAFWMMCGIIVMKSMINFDI